MATALNSMKSVFDSRTRDGLTDRINSLREDSPRQWGNMTVYQMVRHCTLWDDMIQGKQIYKRSLMGRLFGRIALKNVLKNDAPLGKGSPSIPELIISGNGDLHTEKANWAASLGRYAEFSNPSFIHPFFGKMTTEQIGHFVYKHTDHHLRQFNA